MGERRGEKSRCREELIQVRCKLVCADSSISAIDTAKVINSLLFYSKQTAPERVLGQIMGNKSIGDALFREMKRPSFTTRFKDFKPHKAT